MRRDFVFVWGPEVQAAVAALSAPKIAQLRACCIALIARAEHYRQNPMRVVSIVEMPHLTEEDLPWAPFEMFGFWFRLDYQENKAREYVLNFATPPAPRPPDCGRGDSPSRRRGEGRRAAGARPARARTPPKATDKRNLFMSYKTCWREIAQGIVLLYGPLWSTLALSVRAMRDAGGSTLGRARARLDDLRRGVAATLRPVCASFRPSAEPAARRFGPEARLEPRLFGQNSGLGVLLYTLVRDEPPIDWSSNLFGEPCQEGGC